MKWSEKELVSTSDAKIGLISNVRYFISREEKKRPVFLFCLFYVASAVKSWQELFNYMPSWPWQETNLSSLNRKWCALRGLEFFCDVIDNETSQCTHVKYIMWNYLKRRIFFLLLSRLQRCFTFFCYDRWFIFPLGYFRESPGHSSSQYHFQSSAKTGIFWDYSGARLSISVRLG